MKKAILEYFLMLVIVLGIFLSIVLGFHTLLSASLEKDLIETLNKEDYQISGMYKIPTDKWEIVEFDKLQKETDDLKFIKKGVLNNYFYKKRVSNYEYTDFYSFRDFRSKQAPCYIVKINEGFTYTVCNEKPFKKFYDKIVSDIKKSK